jgi:hypothetical protein
MAKWRRAAALAFLLPAAGCVFAVGGDDDGNEELRDRVRMLEHRIDRLEHGGEAPPGPRLRREVRAPAPRTESDAPRPPVGGGPR